MTIPGEISLWDGNSTAGPILLDFSSCHSKVPGYVNQWMQLIWKPRFVEIDPKIFLQNNGSAGAFSLCYCFPIPLWEEGGGQNISCGNQSSRELSSSDSSIEMTSGETGRKMKRVGNREKCSKEYQLENLFDCCNFLSALLKGMTRENWWGWQNINCQAE